MKLCLLSDRLDCEPLYTCNGLYLYYISITEYRKCILKGIVDYDTYNNASICYMYARDILKGRFELGEELIIKDSEYSYWYARIVLRGRFELGEELISTSSKYSTWYAIMVTDKHFELGEDVIRRSHYEDEYEAYFKIDL